MRNELRLFKIIVNHKEKNKSLYQFNYWRGVGSWLNHTYGKFDFFKSPTLTAVWTLESTLNIVS